MASFSPPNETASDWHTNGHQGDKEDENNGDNKGQGKTPQGDSGKREENPPPPYDADGRAVVPTGVYYVANPRNRHGLGQACWDSKKHIFKEIRCCPNTQGDETEWYLGFDRDSTTFTLGPNLGGAKAWEDRKCPLTGYERDDPYDLDRVLAWQTTDSPPRKRWYAIRATNLGGDHYRIVSNRGGLAWTIASEAKSNHDYLEVSLQSWYFRRGIKASQIRLRPMDLNDINQVWELVPKPSR
ncbi:hypothetical protein BKA70DRAFT_264486 [Coprinopsis sp. MPI-PUGE-AT-0042]|nr:hypothetical protein BKA70DRAFT_264486 [Coprinopsis sp. MPI-PUGE-AT-0042]